MSRQHRMAVGGMIVVLALATLALYAGTQPAGGAVAANMRGGYATPRRDGDPVGVAK